MARPRTKDPLHNDRTAVMVSTVLSAASIGSLFGTTGLVTGTVAGYVLGHVATRHMGRAAPAPPEDDPER